MNASLYIAWINNDGQCCIKLPAIKQAFTFQFDDSTIMSNVIEMLITCDHEYQCKVIMANDTSIIYKISNVHCNTHTVIHSIQGGSNKIHMITYMNAPLRHRVQMHPIEYVEDELLLK